MTADRHVAWYAEAMAMLAGFQHDAVGGAAASKAKRRTTARAS